LIGGNILFEKEMYQYVKLHLENLGFEVKAEVLNTDITAVKDDIILVVELKTELNIKLMYQGCMGQKISDYVYLGIPKPTSKKLYSKNFKEKLYILKRLGLGLIFVDVVNQSAETYLDPFIMPLRKNKKKRVKLLKEFENRVTSYNIGGVSKTKIITSYHERSLHIAYHLKDQPRSIRELKALTDDLKCSTILQKNYNKWFDRVERGVYSLNEKGLSQLNNYEHVVQELIKK